MKRINQLTAVILFVFFLFACRFGNGQQTKHPLDPLTWQEYWTVLEVLQKSNHLDADTRFSHINLEQPDKSLVWQGDQSQDIPRVAFAVVHQKEKTFKAHVNLITQKLENWKELKGIQPTWLEQEFGSMIEKVKKYPEFIAAMKKRGYDDLTFIDAHFWPPGYYDTEEQRSRRIAHSIWMDVRNVRNTWAREIEGLTVVVDMNTEEILRVVDEGIVAVPKINIDYDPASIPSVREVPGPIFITQPQGAGFTLD
ncbi:MAG: hypothetical protein HKN31_08500, partial [Pricia sp.]|nr:hypothetical protein [Pricia sp.]